MARNKRPGGSNRLRIIGGRWRGRRLVFPDAAGLRPTPDRVRETLFNWLQSRVPGARVLDAFAGSGALGFEAASRGAGQVLMIERAPRVLRALEHSRDELGAEAVEIRRGNALEYLSHCEDPWDLILLDPPFGQGLAEKSLYAIRESGCLSPEGRVYLEVERQLPLDAALDGWQVLHDRQAGDVRYLLLAQQEQDSSPTS
ncbi:MAG: 16S rRNA (guanine(966)-N(2))-methyltransferase RsmD [Gammaproteobacteria bacterium]|nr:MAG: 16S rRNA (guanine(966)-N(2))-methyltransferase RsmD [Gammaproteobacteria bacterium]